MSRKSRMPIDELRRRTSECLVLHGKSPALGSAVETQSEAVGVLALAGIKNREIAKALCRSSAHVASLKRSTLRQLRQPLARRLRDLKVRPAVATPTVDDSAIPGLNMGIDELYALLMKLEELKPLWPQIESGGSQ